VARILTVPGIFGAVMLDEYLVVRAGLDRVGALRLRGIGERGRTVTGVRQWVTTSGQNGGHGSRPLPPPRARGQAHQILFPRLHRPLDQKQQVSDISSVLEPA
jgi:hypothetical protein